MGRFYKTSKPTYLDDFIYQPNWELASKVLQKKDSDMAFTVEQANLLGDLNFDVWKEANGKEAEEIKAKWENAGNEIVEALKNKDSSKAYKLLAKAQKDLKKDYKEGDIARIRHNATKYREFSKQIKDMTEQDKAIYASIPTNFLKNIEKDNKAKFDFGKLYKKRDGMSEFLKSEEFKSLEEEFDIDTKDKKSGAWLNTIYTKKGGIGLKKVQDAYKLFVENHPDFKDYMKVRQDASKDTPFAETYYDEDGNLTYDNPNTTLGSMFNKLKNYTKITDEEKHLKKINPVWSQSMSWRRSGSGASKELYGLGGSFDTKGYEKTHDGMESIKNAKTFLVTNFYEKIFGKDGSTQLLKNMENLPLSNLMSSLENAINQKNEDGTYKYKKIRNNYYAFKDRFNDEYRAGTEQLAALNWDNKKLTEYRKVLKQYEPQLDNMSFELVAEGMDSGSKKRDYSTIKAGSLNDLVGKDLKGYGKVVGAKRVKESTELSFGQYMDANGDIKPVPVSVIEVTVEKPEGEDINTYTYRFHAYYEPEAINIDLYK